MNISLEEIVAELKANYGLIECIRSTSENAISQPWYPMRDFVYEKHTVSDVQIFELMDDFYYYEFSNAILGVPPSTLPKWTRETDFSRRKIQNAVDKQNSRNVIIES